MSIPCFASNFLIFTVNSPSAPHHNNIRLDHQRAAFDAQQKESHSDISCAAYIPAHVQLSCLKSNKQTTSSVYDRLASRYDRAMQPLERLLLARLRAEAWRELPADASCILEVGSGTGVNFPFYPKDARGACVELSFEMIRQAQTKPRPRAIRLVQASAEQLPFADNSFDAALATLVFCSIASPAQAFAEVRRVVRAGGRVVLLEHVRPRGLLGPVFDALSLLTVPLFDDHFNRRTAEEAWSAGLRVLRVEPHALGIVQLIMCEV